MALRRKLELNNLRGHQDQLFQYAHEETGAGAVKAHSCHSASIQDQSLGLRLPAEPFPAMLGLSVLSVILKVLGLTHLTCHFSHGL